MNHVDRLKLQSEIIQLPLLDLQAMTARLQWLTDGRAEQMPPDESDEGWFLWLAMAGRGFGKTRAGAEDMWWFAYTHPGSILAVVGSTSDDCRKVCFEGESGLLARTPPALIANWNRGEKLLTLTNGSRLQGYSADEPDRLRGPQHHRAWCDELAAWRYLDDTLDNLLMGLRLGRMPRIVATTTPRPIRRIKEIAAERRNAIPGFPPPKEGGTTHLDTGSTYANSANLPKIFLDTILKRYEGTRLGRQELHAALLTDMPGALWQMSQIEADRAEMIDTETVRGRSGQPVRLVRKIVSADPATKSKKEDSSKGTPDEWGVVVMGLGDDGRGYVLADLSQTGTPAEIGRIIVKAYDEWNCDRVVYESNQGGEMVLLVITTAAADLRREGEREVDFVATQDVWASKGKVTRAEPASALYEQHRVSHCGSFPKLEDQMGEFTSDFDRNKMGYSPDRVDALVWAVTHLMLSSGVDGTNIRDFYRRDHADMVDRARAAATGGLSAHGAVRLVPPPGISSASGISGHQYTVNANGWMEVAPDDVPPLRAAGFRTWEEEMAA